MVFEDRYTLLGSDVFINCSVNYGTEYNITSWLFDNEPLLINETSRFSQNTSGLIIYNMTELDEGYYTCYVGEIWADIHVHIASKIYYTIIQCYTYMYGNNIVLGPPISVSKGDQTVMVSVSEEVILNCTVSASPDPVYSWSFPDSCSSCPNTSNGSVLIFTAENITDSGEYTCVVENEYGNISITFDVSVTSKYLV